MREHNEAVNRLDFWPNREAMTATYAEGGILKLRKLTADYDPTNRINATTHIAQAAEKGEVLTGLLYVAPDAEDLHAHLNTFPTAFNTLGAKGFVRGVGCWRSSMRRFGSSRH